MRAAPFCHCLALATLLAAVQAASATARQIDCQSLFSEAIRDASDAANWSFDGLVDTLPNYLRALVGSDDPAVDAPTYLMTRIQGSALFMNCDKPFTRYTYFPVGLVLMERFPFTFNDTEYVLALSEDGVNLVLERDWVLEIGPDDAFIVGDWIERIPVCLNSIAANPDCDAHVASRASEPLIDTKTSYIHATPDPMLAWRLDYLGRLRDAAILEPARFESRIRALDRTGADHYPTFCERFDAGSLYHKGQRPGAEPDFRMVSLSLCRRREDGTVVPRALRIVTRDWARTHFSDWSSFVFRNQNHLTLAVLARVGRADRAIDLSHWKHKTCTQRSVSETEMEASLELALGGSYRVFTGEAGVALRNKSLLVDLAREGKMFQTTAVMVNGGAEIYPYRRNTIYDIILVALCGSGDLPQEVNRIIFNHPAAGSDVFLLDGNEIRSVYRATLQENTGALTGYPSLSDRKNELNKGVFWNIRSPVEYFVWRTVLRRVFAEQPFVMNLEIDGDRKARLVDHLAHTLMAALFVSSVSPRGGTLALPPPPQ